MKCFKNRLLESISVQLDFQWTAQQDTNTHPSSSLLSSNTYGLTVKSKKV